MLSRKQLDRFRRLFIVGLGLQPQPRWTETGDNRVTEDGEVRETEG